MLFGKYHIVIFKEGRSGSRSLRIRGVYALLAILLAVVLVICNVLLFRVWLDTRHLDTDLGNSQRLLEDQRRQLIDLAERLGTVSRDLLRVQNFDAKLRIMMNMEKDPPEIGAPGDFSRTYLPLHRQELAARKMRDFLDRLSESVRLEEVAQQDLLRTLRQNRNILSSMPSIWPATGFVSSSFGMRSSPFGRGRRLHKGLDISNRTGTPVMATAQGTVILAAPDGAYGLCVEVDHGGGIVTKYAHLHKFIVEKGQWVKRGQIIGHMGSTGRSTGPHLHYEVRLNGVPVDPMRYILE